MIILFVAGILLVAYGVGSLLFPNLTRRLDRFDHGLRGLQSNQGEANGAGRVLRGFGMIVLGLAMLLLPWLVFR